MKLAAFDPWRRRSADWWTARSMREQILLGVFGALAILALFLIAIVRPLQAERARALAEIRTADMLTMRVRAAGPSLASQARMRHGSASSILTESTASAGLSVQRIEPEGGRTRVALGDAPFEAVVRWVADIEATSSLRVVEARIERQPAPGMVSAQFLVTG